MYMYIFTYLILFVFMEYYYYIFIESKVIPLGITFLRHHILIIVQYFPHKMSLQEAQAVGIGLCITHFAWNLQFSCLKALSSE